MCAGQEPVFALMPVPGEVDVVIASELMEAGRAVQRGLVTADRTTLIASTHRVYSMIEKSALGDGRVDSAAIIDACEGASKKLVQGDFAAIAALGHKMCGTGAGYGFAPVTEFGVALEQAIPRDPMPAPAALTVQPSSPA